VIIINIVEIKNETLKGRAKPHPLSPLLKEFVSKVMGKE
jgi:hypothetical protein